MAVKVLDKLIDKEDTFEIVRDKISEILLAETANQVDLAAAEPNPSLWAFKVYLERSNAFEQFLPEANAPDKDVTPIVNIWYDNGSFPGNQGDTVERQVHEAVYNIDCYASGVSSDNPAGGHNPGDKAAALNVQRILRLIRNILMSNVNTYLQLQGIVGRRWPNSITMFQPSIDNRATPNVIGARLALRVKFNEFSPQQTPEILELVSVDIKRLSDGQVVLEADYDQTPPI